MQRVWKTDKRGGYHVEYGYSCMGYEVGASLGVKMAEPDVEEYTCIGDSGFQMLTSLQSSVTPTARSLAEIWFPQITPRSAKLTA